MKSLFSFALVSLVALVFVSPALFGRVEAQTVAAGPDSATLAQWEACAKVPGGMFEGHKKLKGRVTKVEGRVTKLERDPGRKALAEVVTQFAASRGMKNSLEAGRTFMSELIEGARSGYRAVDSLRVLRAEMDSLTARTAALEIKQAQTDSLISVLFGNQVDLSSVLERVAVSAKYRKLGKVKEAELADDAWTLAERLRLTSLDLP